MAITDLLFIICFLVFAVLLIRLLWLGLRGRSWRSTAIGLVAFLAIYASALVVLAKTTPRREVARGQRKCYDEWCVSVKSFTHLPESPAWIAELEISSEAKRVQQRAADASVELEDTAGNRYSPDPIQGGHGLRDMLEPGKSFLSSLQFKIPPTAHPAGLIVHHGAFPGVMIIGDDQSWLHPPTLFRVN